MPSIEKANRFQFAVYWEAAGSVINNYGRRSFYEPVQLNVRWEKTFRQVMSATSEVVTIEATVFTGIEIAVGSVFWLGKLVDVPSPLVNLFEVVGFEDTPDIRGKINQQDALLKRRSDLVVNVVGTGSA